jgi:general stress protein 26
MALKDEILGVIKGPKLSALGTLIEESGQVFPVVRYMVTTGRDDLSLTAFTSASSRKVSQIEKNPNASLTIRNEGNFSSPHVTIRAKAEIIRDPETKRKLWGPHLEKNVKNPEDPKYVAIRFVPSQIEYYSEGKVEVWKS